MPWTYEQNTGRLLTPTGRLLAIGYSGLANGKNNPDLELIHNLGPIPRGTWIIQPADVHPKHGPVSMHLSPAEHVPISRCHGFMCHGDYPDHKQDASHGCIVLPRYARERLSLSADRVLLVTLAHPDQDA